MSTKPRLTFNSARAAAGYKKAVQNAADQLLKDLYEEISQKLNTSESKKDLQKMTENEEMIFRRKVIGCADAIMDSYGTGSKMDTHYNQALDEYKQSSLYNPARQGKRIVGRSEGKYTNIYGETVTSSGKMEGKSIEGFYKPISPSYAFQRAETWFTKGNGSKVNEVLSRYLAEYIKGMHQYFDYR